MRDAIERLQLERKIAVVVFLALVALAGLVNWLRPAAASISSSVSAPPPDGEVAP